MTWDFSAVFQEYYPTILYFFQRRCFAQEEAQDLAQETFVRVHRNLAGFRGEAQMRTWLFRIAGNVWLNEIRRRSTEKRSGWEIPLESAPDHGQALYEVAAGAPQPLQTLLQDERRRALYAAFSELPPQMRRCVELRIGQDLKLREIANLMQVSIETVKAHIYQARQRLKSQLASHFPELEKETGDSDD